MGMRKQACSGSTSSKYVTGCSDTPLSSSSTRSLHLPSDSIYPGGFKSYFQPLISWGRRQGGSCFLFPNHNFIPSYSSTVALSPTFLWASDQIWGEGSKRERSHLPPSWWHRLFNRVQILATAQCHICCAGERGKPSTFPIWMELHPSTPVSSTVNLSIVQVSREAGWEGDTGRNST